MLDAMKLLVIDDHPLVRRGLVSLLDGAMPGTAVFEAADAETALALLSRHADLDAVLLDLFMPGMGGLAALSELAQARPDLPVVVLSSSERPEDVRTAMAHGALGYVPKSARAESDHSGSYPVAVK